MKKTFLLTLPLIMAINNALAGGFLMWQAQREDRTIHLLANIPVMSGDLIPSLAPEIQQAFEKSNLVVFESDPDVERRKEGRKQIIDSALYPEGDDLLNHLPKATRRDFQNICNEYKISTDNIVRLRPWMAAQNLLQIISVRAQVRLGDDLEKHFYRRAVTDDKALAFLSTPRVTIDMYAAMPEELQVKLLDKSIRDARTMTNFLSRVETAWKSTDADEATSLITESFRGYPDIYQALFVSRNRGWAADLESQSGIEDQVFVLVSLSNLVGTDNLLEQLKSLGFRIAQVVPE
jgi:uncharacterized protein YbaP (TraB family)